MTGQTIYAYVKGNPLSYSDPLGLWPLGAPRTGFDFMGVHVPSQSTVIGQLQQALLQAGATGDKDFARQIASDITDEVGWSDLPFAKSLVAALDSGKPLTNDQQISAKKFINRLPKRDRDPLGKLLCGDKK